MPAKSREDAILLEQLDQYLRYALSTPARRTALRIGRTVSFTAHALLPADTAAMRVTVARLFEAPGKLLREEETHDAVDYQGVVPAGPGSLNLVLLTISLCPRGSRETEVQVRGAAREGIFSLRTAEHTVQQVMAHLSDRFHTTAR